MACVESVSPSARRSRHQSSTSRFNNPTAAASSCCSREDSRAAMVRDSQSCLAARLVRSRSRQVSVRNIWFAVHRRDRTRRGPGQQPPAPRSLRSSTADAFPPIAPGSIRLQDHPFRGEAGPRPGKAEGPPVGPAREAGASAFQSANEGLRRARMCAPSRYCLVNGSCGAGIAYMNVNCKDYLRSFRAVTRIIGGIRRYLPRWRWRDRFAQRKIARQCC